MNRSQPLTITLPRSGVVFAESFHAADFYMPERTDPFHKLLYVRQGEVEYRLPAHGGWQRIPSGSLILVPADQLHALRDIKAASLLLLCFDRSFLDSDPAVSDLWRQLLRRVSPAAMLSRPSRARLESWWRQALIEAAFPRTGTQVMSRILAAQILVWLARLAPSRHVTDSATARVASVLAEVEETFNESWDLNRGASRAGISRRRFSALVRQAQGIGFHQHLIGLRLNYAKRLLQEPSRSITDIIFSCGFADSSTFYRAFHKRCRCSPLQWRRQQTPATAN